jgi:hypothetical protein
MNSEMDRVSATAKKIDWSDLVTDLDLLRTNADVRASMTKAGVEAVNRKIDKLIIDALDASTNTVVTLPTANTLDSAGLIKLSETLGLLEIPFENRTLVTSWGGMTDMLSDTKIPSRDYLTSKAYSDGFVDNVMGFKIIAHTNLPIPTSGKREVYAYHKNAVGLHIVQDLKLNVAKIDIKDAWLVHVKAMMGAVIIRPEGVQFAQVND